MWMRVESCGLSLYQVEQFVSTGLVSHASTTLHGGSGRYGGLNLGLHVGDDSAAVVDNRRRVCRALGCGLDDLVSCEQVHGTRIAVVDDKDAGRGAMEYSTALPQTDGLITATPGVMLSLYFADCVPVLLLDPVTPAVGLAHAGWKGTAGRIAVRALEAMAETFGTSPSDCLAAVGPSIGPCCYEVGEEVAQAVAASVDGGERCVGRDGRLHTLDLPEANMLQLADAGIRPESIAAAGICTRCQADGFFSHRRVNPTGRMGTYLMLAVGR